MKAWIWSLFMVPMLHAQTITLKDGSKIDADKLHIEPGNKRVTYWLKDDPKMHKVKFSVLQQTENNGSIFRMVDIDGKPRGVYIIADANGKQLVSTKRVRIKNRGGFESTYTHYEVMVLEQGRAVEALSFTDDNKAEKANERAKVIPMIERHFAGCPKLVERAKAFESTSADAQHKTVLVLLNEPTFVDCR